MATSTLDALLSALSIDVEAFALCEIGPEVELIFPPMDVIEIHHVLEGTLHLTIGEDEPIIAPAGSMVMVPRGRLQRLAASAAAATSSVSSDLCLPVHDRVVVIDATGGSGAALRVACGTVLPDLDGSYGLLDGLSQPVSESLSDVPVVATAFGAMLEEVATPLEGTMALTSALMKACLIVLLRRHLQSSRNSGTLPGLFADIRIARAIAAVLDGPAAPHSLASLAKEAGMSRSAFAREFKSTLDVTPMEFVTRVRLNRARQRLAATGNPVETIASDVGFRSRSHFSRLFREHFGTDPSTFRRRNLPIHRP